MGMYDQLRFSRPMPDGFQTDDWYQTKSMECDLVDYEVDADGQLWEVGICEEPDPNGKVKVTYTGVVNFYALIDHVNREQRVFKNYVAVFRDGLLRKLRASGLGHDDAKWIKFPEVTTTIAIDLTYNADYGNDSPYVHIDDIPAEYRGHILERAVGSGAPAPAGETKLCLYEGDTERWLRLLGVRVEFVPKHIPASHTQNG